MQFADQVRPGTMDRLDAMHVLDALRGQDR